MIIKEITARTLLSPVKYPDPWFGLKYTMNLYRGCQHQCIYCDSRSECYQIENFNQEVLVKTNAVELLQAELPRKRVKGTIGIGSMNDPYMPLEAKLNLTGRALQVIAQHQFPVHIITKSDLVLKDLETLLQINRIYLAVSFTITTADDDLGRKVEPGAPLVSQRFRAMEILASHGILTGITLMPVLPFIEDQEENIAAIVTRAHDCDAAYILPAFGMTLRDRQRTYYYRQLDRLFPGLRQKYELHFGQRYSCSTPNASHLEVILRELCDRFGLATRLKPYTPATSAQLSLW